MRDVGAALDDEAVQGRVRALDFDQFLDAPVRHLQDLCGLFGQPQDPEALAAIAARERCRLGISVSARKHNILSTGTACTEYTGFLSGTGDADVQQAWSIADAAATPPNLFATAPPASVPQVGDGFRRLEFIRIMDYPNAHMVPATDPELSSPWVSRYYDGAGVRLLKLRDPKKTLNHEREEPRR